MSLREKKSPKPRGSPEYPPLPPASTPPIHLPASFTVYLIVSEADGLLTDAQWEPVPWQWIMKTLVDVTACSKEAEKGRTLHRSCYGCIYLNILTCGYSVKRARFTFERLWVCKRFGEKMWGRREMKTPGKTSLKGHIFHFLHLCTDLISLH